MIYNLRSKVSVIFLCDYFSINRSWFYKWLQKRETVSNFNSKYVICSEIKKSFEESDKTYGSPRVYDDLVEKGFKVSENTVAKYMREMGLNARLKKKYRVMTTDSNHSHSVAERLFKTEDQGSHPRKPGEVLAGDITYLRLSKNSFVYLAVVLDLYNREVIGWSMSKSLKTRLVIDALHMATTKVGPNAEVIFHSDRGVQYASKAYKNFLKNQDIKPSMSRRGNCYDNAFVESFFSSLKKEKIYRNKDLNTEEKMKTAVFEYIETWYNTKRKHSSLDMMSPIKYKQVNQNMNF